MLALIDNYDSFTYNLVQLLGELGADVRVFRNDQVSLEELAALEPDRLVISPGPGQPMRDGGVSAQAITHFTGKIPVLGVCLGHQCLGAVYGARVDRAPRLMHGKTSAIYHDGQGIFNGLPSPFEAMRYHSLVVYAPVPDDLAVVAETAEKEVMALRHRSHPTYGVQFHPESILTEHGRRLLKNFLDLTPQPPSLKGRGSRTSGRDENPISPFNQTHPSNPPISLKGMGMPSDRDEKHISPFNQTHPISPPPSLKGRGPGG
jgi:anthranilate synthase/aminodeoxychorismate synthase-like glutamine amidotransferase